MNNEERTFIGGDLHACTVEVGNRAIVEDLLYESIIPIGDAEFLLGVGEDDFVCELDDILYDQGYYIEYTEGGQYAYVGEITE